jgi:hypothetical protein
MEGNKMIATMMGSLFMLRLPEPELGNQQARP